MPKADIGSFKKISESDFEKVELRTGKISGVKKHPKDSKLYVLLIECPVADEDIQVVAALAESYSMTALLGNQVIVLCNLPVRDVKGVESQGMLLVSNEKNPSLIAPQKPSPSGGIVYALSDKRIIHKD